jgi:hypothetical protein
VLTAAVSGVILTTKPTITVTAGTVSGANSTVSFASPTVASGITDTVTLIVKDTTGNAVSGLPNSAFSFALSGGTSTGTFGAVTATATPGTYTAVFTGATAGTASTLTAIVNGVTLTTRPKIRVFSPHKLYITAVYQDVLGRAPDANGLDYWSNQLDANPSQRLNLISLISHSAEYFTTIIIPAYQQFLGRAPDAAGLAFWVGQMQNGMTDEQLQAGFIGSPEYYAHSGGKGTAWVDAMYNDLLGRTPDTAGEGFWVQAIQAGAQKSQVALGFAASAEREGILVQGDYSHYLHRAPSSNEVAFWVNTFEQGGTNEQLVSAFLASDEYYQRTTAGG